VVVDVYEDYVVLLYDWVWVLVLVCFLFIWLVIWCVGLVGCVDFIVVVDDYVLFMVEGEVGELVFILFIK